MKATVVVTEQFIRGGYKVDARRLLEDQKELIVLESSVLKLHRDPRWGVSPTNQRSPGQGAVLIVAD